MPTLFLSAAVLGALFTWNAYHPIRSQRHLSAISFFCGWLTSELAMHHVVWEVVATIFFIRAGALSAWQGWLGLAIAFGNWFALIIDAANGWGSRRVTAQALDDALGPGWRNRLTPELSAKVTRVAMRQLFVPIPVTHPDVVRTRHVTFYEEPKFRLQLDVYRHRSKPTNTPTLLYVHGGAWILGDKSTQGLPVLHHLAALGWTCFGINYRLSPRATFPDHLVDVKRAIAWVKEHGAEHGANPDFLVLCGGSAGAHLSSLAALTPKEKVFQPGFEDVDCSVSACVPLYGVFDFVDRAKVWPHQGMKGLVTRLVMKTSVRKAAGDWDRASPIFWISPDAPPFFVIHGERDSLVPRAESQNFAQALRAVSRAPVALAIIPGAQHAFEIFPSPRAAGTVEGIADFLLAMYSEHLQHRVGLRAPSDGAVVEKDTHGRVGR